MTEGYNYSKLEPFSSGRFAEPVDRLALPGRPRLRHSIHNTNAKKMLAIAQPIAIPAMTPAERPLLDEFAVVVVEDELAVVSGERTLLDGFAVAVVEDELAVVTGAVEDEPVVTDRAFVDVDSASEVY